METEEQELAQLAEAVRYVLDLRNDDRPFDIICEGITPGAEPVQAAQTVKRRADLGAT